MLRVHSAYARHALGTSGFMRSDAVKCQVSDVQTSQARLGPKNERAITAPMTHQYYLSYRPDSITKA